MNTFTRNYGQFWGLGDDKEIQIFMSRGFEGSLLVAIVDGLGAAIEVNDETAWADFQRKGGLATLGEGKDF